MSAIRGLHYKVRKLFLIEQEGAEFLFNSEFKEIKEIKEFREYGVIIKLPKFPKFSKFPKNLLPLEKKMAYERSNSNKVTRRS